MKDKKWLIIIGLIILILVIIFIVKITNKEDKIKEENTTDDFAGNEYIDVKEDGTRVNKSEKFSTTKEIEGLKISNIELTEKENVTQILADIKNTTDKDVEGFYVSINFLDKNGESIVSLGGYIPTVEANGTATLNTNSTGDFANAYDYTIEKIEDGE